MFKFNFKVEDSSEFEESKADEENEEKDEQLQWYESEKVEPTKDMLEIMDVYKANSAELVAGSVTLTYMIAGWLLKSNKQTGADIQKAETQHTDLIPGVYEGGAKIWECTFDLIKYMSQNYAAADCWQGKRVLDVGCGSGLLGIYAYKNGAKVQFQDYNKDVLEQITIPNVLINVPAPPNAVDLNLENLANEVQFYAGDWQKYADLTTCSDHAFDVILSSETIYNAFNQNKLLNLFDAKLTRNGTIFIAAKTYYFGVGGGLRQFEKAILADERFESNVVWTTCEGVSREIVKLKRKL